MDKVACVVVGAGVVGIAVARTMAMRGHEVLVIEKHPGIGMETSSRNSEVIHAGLYYPTGSLKARLCIAGREALYAYCADRAIAHRRCGKLIVATSAAQLPRLAAIHAQAHANGCREVSALTVHEARELEPELSCVAALSSPNTGIIDTQGYMLALQADAENAGALFAFASEVVSARASTNGLVLRTRSADGDEIEFEASQMINCAGLWAPQLARRVEGLDQTAVPAAHFAKGNYYSLDGKAPFSRLVYPVPEPGGLGVHLTLDLGGQARFGPDVEWLDDHQAEIDYTVDPRRAERFYQEIRAYWPRLRDASLHPAYAGVRPKISSADDPAADFLFSQHGNPHYLGLYGIESPGLTASLAIAEHAADIISTK